MASQLPGEQPTPKGKSPFQLRFDILHLAKDILEQNAHMAREDKAKDRKTFFTTDEVIEVAEKLNEFISRKR
jgi:hypothetical protein